MIAFPSMLVPAAKQAEMAVPENIEDYDPMEFPHWHVFLMVQLGAPMPHMGVHWDNAKVIAGIPSDMIMVVTGDDLEELGVWVGFSHAYA